MLAEKLSAADVERRTRMLLPRVSRTFALGIKLLPARLEAPVRVGYLLCRIADTIEDDLALSAERKDALLNDFLECFEDQRRAASFAGEFSGELVANNDYLDLVSATGDVFDTFRSLDPAAQAVLLKWITEMVRGMRKFVVNHPTGIRIATLDEFREYCYFVAGTVGHLLTDLWQVHSRAIDSPTYERLLGNCEAFGEALQSVNILKDIAWDAEKENAIYVPGDLLAAAGSGHAMILDHGSRPANRAALAPLFALAQEDIERALRYIEHLPLPAIRIRIFCALPILFAIATMREIERSEAMLVSGGNVKISRSEVSALIVATSTSVLTNHTLRWLVERVRLRPFSLGGG